MASVSTPPNTPPPGDQPRAAYTPNLAQIDPPANFGRIALRIVLAAVATSLLVGAYFYFGRHKPVAMGDVTRVSLYPIHSVLGEKSDVQGMPGQTEQYDQLIVFAEVHVHNQSDDPLVITELRGDITLADATQPTSRAASPNDFSRLFGAYPQIASLRSDPLRRDTTIAPGATADGLVIFNYSMSKAQWDQKKLFNISVSFSNGTVIQIDATRV
jgi:hypothetical protein